MISASVSASNRSVSTSTVRDGPYGDVSTGRVVESMDGGLSENGAGRSVGGMTCARLAGADRDAAGTMLSAVTGSDGAGDPTMDGPTGAPQFGVKSTSGASTWLSCASHAWTR